MESQESRRLTVTLEQMAGGGMASSTIADAIVSTWNNIDATLTPIIGPRGVAALYERSLFLARASHPWLATIRENPDAQMDLADLLQALVKQDSASAAAGGGAHLQTLYELLGSLIGPALTEQLLHLAWANAFASPDAGNLST